VHAGKGVQDKAVVFKVSARRGVCMKFAWDEKERGEQLKNASYGANEELAATKQDISIMCSEQQQGVQGLPRSSLL